MLFSGITFLFYFLPCTLIIYFIAPKFLKNTVLLISSLIFYAWGEPRYVLLMLLTILCGYISGILIEHFRGKSSSKAVLAASAVIFIAVLGYFKYADFFISSFNTAAGTSLPLLKTALPVGISFYTFQILSYTIDVYRGDVPAQRNFINLAAYTALFPQLIAGPIVRYSDIASQLDKRTHSIEKSALGIRFFIIGLSKKIFIANTLGELCGIFRASDDKSVMFYWLYAIGYSLQIYFDFSGYSDMASGLGKILGFDFPENFRYPYISSSITEFWRRWHISLGKWFRDYVYIPLGGNRVSWICHLRNILIVWLLTGFWHGAAWNFILWGLFFALLLIIEKMIPSKLTGKVRITSHLYVITAVVISFVIFGAENLSEAASYLKHMFGFGEIPIYSVEFMYYFRSYAVILTSGIIAATPLPKKLFAKLNTKKPASLCLAVLEPCLLAAMFICAVSFIANGSFNPFLYFRF